MTSTSLGTMNLEMPLWSLHHLIIASLSSFEFFFTVMYAFGRSPNFSSLTATIAHSKISGWVTRTDSSATEEMFSPPKGIRQSTDLSNDMSVNIPEMMMSFARSRIWIALQ